MAIAIKKMPYGFLRLLAFLLAAAWATALWADSTEPSESSYLDALRALQEGRENDASDDLSRAIEAEPEHAGALLDLAILQCDLGHATEAARLLRLIESRFDPPPAIRAVIAGQRTRDCSVRHWASRTSLLLGRGTDSNANVGPDTQTFSIGSGSTAIQLTLLPNALPKRDSYSVLAFAHERSLTTNGLSGFIQGRIRGNDTERDYDTASFQAGIEQPWQSGVWRGRASGSVGLLTVGGSLYQRYGQVRAYVDLPLSLPEHLRISLQSGLTRFDYPTRVTPDSNQLELGASVSRTAGDSKFEMALSRLADRRASAQLGGDRQGWLATLRASAPLPAADIRAELAWQRMTWQSAQAYSPGLIDVARHQDVRLWNAALVVPLGKAQSLRLEWLRTRDRENIPLLAHESRMLQASWQRSFGP